MTENAVTPSRDALADALAVILARVRCEAVHHQTSGGRCVSCISWAERIGVPQHLPRLERVAVPADSLAADALACIKISAATFYDDNGVSAPGVARVFRHLSAGLDTRVIPPATTEGGA